MNLILKGFGGQKGECHQENSEIFLGIRDCGHLLGTESRARDGGFRAYNLMDFKG